jgi:hypothetical protein
VPYSSGENSAPTGEDCDSQYDRFRSSGERYAFDFTATATRLPPEQAPVISIEEKRNPRARKIRPSIAA